MKGPGRDMGNDDLTLADSALILLLMAIGTEVANTELVSVHGVDIDKKQREDLVTKGLIKTRMDKRRLYWSLTGAGWRRGRRLLSAKPTRGGGVIGVALKATAALIGRHLERSGGDLAEFYPAASASASAGAGGDAGAALDAATIEERIRKAYRALARRGGDWVKLVDLREQLGGLDRAQVDAVLRAMNRTPSVTIVPESNQKALTEADRAAAVIIGNQPKHAISIERA